MDQGAIALAANGVWYHGGTMSTVFQREWFRWGMVLAVAFWLGALGWSVAHLRNSPWVGLHLDVVDTSVVIARCDPGSPADHVGIEPGDTLLGVGGRVPWQAFLADHDQSPSWADVDRFWEGQSLLRDRIQQGRAVRLEVRGPEGSHSLAVVPGLLPWDVLVRKIALPNLLALVWMVTAILVVRKVRNQQSGVMLLAATSIAVLVSTMAVIVQRELGAPIASQVWMQRLNHMAATTTSLSAFWFGTIFPVRLRWLHRPRGVFLAGLALGWLLLVAGQFARWAPGPIHLSYGASSLIHLAMLGTLSLVFFRSRQAVHRRQIQWVFLGFLAGVLPYLLLTAGPLILGWPSLPQEVTSLGSVALPIAFGLAIRRWGLFTVSSLFDGGLLRLLWVAMLFGLQLGILFGVTLLWDEPTRIDPAQVVVILVVVFAWSRFRRRFLPSARLAGLELEELRRELPLLVERLGRGESLAQALGGAIAHAFGTDVLVRIEPGAYEAASPGADAEWVVCHRKEVVDRLEAAGGLVAGFELPGADNGEVPADVESCLLVAVPGRGVEPGILVLGPRWSPDSWSAHDVGTVRSLLGVAIPLGEAAARWHVEENRRRSLLVAAREELEVRVAERTSELESANAQLREALATRESFLAQMSHELRTPLSAVLGGVETIREGVDGPVGPPMARRLGMVERNGRHLLALIQDILDFTRGRAGKLPITPVPCRPRVVLEQVLELVGPLLADSGGRVACSPVADGERAVLADPLRLRQILTNLVSNALRHGRGLVEVDLVDEGGRGGIRIAVSDRGPGVSAGMVERLFQPFERFGPEKDPRASTGLGLALSRQLAQAMGGELTYRPREGGGAQFDLRLPATEALPAPDEPAARVPRERRGSGRSLLVVDDQKDLRELCVEYFEALGWDVVGASDVEEAHQAQADGSLDAILTDLGLPGKDGVSLVEAVRGRPDGGRVVVVVLTGAALPEERDRCLRAGADLFLVKPVLLSDLAARMDALVQDRLRGA